MKCVSAVAAMAFAACVLAQGSYPGKAVTTVVGFEPGGGTDTTARIIAPALSELLGQQVVVENRAGAGGDIAVDYVAKQTPDGYSLVLANVGALAVNPHILKTPYDPLKDLQPITMAVIARKRLTTMLISRGILLDRSGGMTGRKGFSRLAEKGGDRVGGALG